MVSVKRTYKDSLFCRLFGSEDYKDYALDLYNALSGSSYDDPGAIEITTIENTVYLGRKNDVSYLIGDEMVLLEHQTTRNPNMPIRGLQYFGKLYAKYIELNDLDEYGKQRAVLPSPRFLVLYFGEENAPEKQIMRLSDSFAGGPGDIEVTVTVLNCNEGHNEAIMKSCKSLRGYAHLLELERRFRNDDGMTLANAVNEAVAQCIEDGYLSDYLIKHRAEAQDMLFTIEDEERALRVHYAALEREATEKGMAKGMAQGMAKGMEQGLEQARSTLVQNAARMVKSGVLTLEDAASGLDLTVQEIENAM